MRSTLVPLICVLISAVSVAQVGFEPQTPCTSFPSPLGAGGDPEGISWNGGSGSTLATVNSILVCGFPTTGSQYAWICAGGPVSVPAGGPLPRPATNPATEVRIPIPAKATSVSLSWDFYTAEVFQSASFNDGISIDVVDSGGNVLVNIAYADTYTPRGSCYAASTCAIGHGMETVPDGVQFVFTALPALPPGAYLSAVCWNGGDDDTVSALAMDSVFFGGTPGSGARATENCAVSLASFTHQGTCVSNTHLDPTAALDLAASNNYFSLCGADEVIFELGVPVVDLGAGPDFQIEEVSASITECYRVQVSTNGGVWHEVPGPYPSCTGGPGVWAGDSAIDIAGIVSPPNTVRFVRLIGASGVTAGVSPGPDIDSIVAINYALPNIGGRYPVYADMLIGYDQGTTTSATLTDGSRALGRPDAYHSESWNSAAGWQATWHNFVSLGAGAHLTVFFMGDWITDDPGPDLVVHEYHSPEGQYTVEVSDDAHHWYAATPYGSVSPSYGNGAVQTDNMLAFDLAGSGLARADYVRLVSTSAVSAGGTPGPEIDAIEALHTASKDRRLTAGPILWQGATVPASLVATAAHVGDQAITLFSVTPPSAPGAGIPLSGGTEFRLPLNDPILDFALYNPAASTFITGVFGTIPSASFNVITWLSLPPSPPSLAGVELFWQSVLVGPGTIRSSNIMRTVVQ